MTTIRPPAVAGRFYPCDAHELGSTVDALLAAVPATGGPAPKALIAPHAGYACSGSVAAAAYARLGRYRHRYTRVVLLGPCHYVPVVGVAVSGADAFRTPLDDVALDTEAIASLDQPDVSVFDRTHRFEHSLEVNLPFLQRVLESFLLIPLVVGDIAPARVADLLETLWGGSETLIVVSSDLSHYLTYDEARAVDASTCAAIERLDEAVVDHEHACGATPLGGLLIAARRRGLTVSTLDLCNSGDTCSDKHRVVGYGAWMLCESG